MVRRIVSFIAVLMLLTGLSLLLYPSVSNYVQSVRHRRVIFNYLSSVEMISDEDYSEIFEAAQAYNEKLAKAPIPLLSMDEQQKAEYENVLDITGTGIMGYINIEKVHINLPIYHGSSESVLQVGVGHIEGSSLPVGGESSHCMLSGHRGLPSAELFTHLDKLDLGDTFTLHVLDEYFTYEVSEIEVIEPHEVQGLKIEQGKDICTLITCTPYGVNSHRLLIHGTRIYIPIEEEKLAIQSGARRVDMLYIIAVVEVPVLIFSVIFSVRSRRKRITAREKR